MSSFFKRGASLTFVHSCFLGLLGLLVGPDAFAINLNSIYTAACQRDVGLIMQVGEQNIQFLSLEGGKVKTVPKHEIIYLAYYPMDVLPMVGVRNPEDLDYYQVQTSNNGSVRELVRGWPIGFTKDKIAFLNPDGQESVVSRRSLFSLKETQLKGSRSFNQKRSYNKYQFVHPYQFRDCPSDQFNQGSTKIFPQQVLSHPVMIKRELDEFQSEAQRLKRYNREQKFYPVPEVFGNVTSLGLWHTFGYRHGGSSKRVSNFTPVLTDSYSSDIFDYQHTFVAGSAPIMTSLHEEPQVHSLYSFKASYFHFSAMADPNLILVGRNYEWQDGDFEGADDRWNSVSQIEMGFDFGHWAIQLYLADVYQVGMHNGIELENEAYGLNRFGLSYRTHKFAVEASLGVGKEEDEEGSGVIYTTKLSGHRVNVTLFDLWKADWTYSLILRRLDFESSRFLYSSEASTHAIYVSYPWSRRYRLGGFLSVENHSNDYSQTGTSDSDSATYVKAGASFSLNF
ncbi:MAG: hypothetical protein H6624_02890 [Bdellovibrionaceae bacterium]|nr:hypothetical protein [Bdellovibrionales bacterium]MCB9083259.1 hypothetical protein [Pseudobdellovibrionaceae bacterium]